MSRLDHALVLTAGLGTRLNPLTLVRAKPAVPVAGTPIVRRIAGWAEQVSPALLLLARTAGQLLDQGFVS